MTLDVSRLTPADCVAALRSFPRRFRAVLALAEDEEDRVLHQPGPDGRSALEHADLAGRDLAMLADAVRRSLVEDRPTVHPAVADAAAREYAYGVDQSADTALDLLSLEAEALADRVEHVAAEDWARPVAVAGAGEAAALDLLREAARTTAAHLAAAQRARSGV